MGKKQCFSDEQKAHNRNIRIQKLLGTKDHPILIDFNGFCTVVDRFISGKNLVKVDVGFGKEEFIVAAFGHIRIKLGNEPVVPFVDAAERHLFALQEAVLIIDSGEAAAFAGEPISFGLERIVCTAFGAEDQVVFKSLGQAFAAIGKRIAFLSIVSVFINIGVDAVGDLLKRHTGQLLRGIDPNNLSLHVTDPAMMSPTGIGKVAAAHPVSDQSTLCLLYQLGC